MPARHLPWLHDLGTSTDQASGKRKHFGLCGARAVLLHFWHTGRACFKFNRPRPASSSTDPSPPPLHIPTPNLNLSPLTTSFCPHPNSPTALGPHVRTTLLCALTQQTTSRHNHDDVIIFCILKRDIILMEEDDLRLHNTTLLEYLRTGQASDRVSSINQATSQLPCAVTQW